MKSRKHYEGELNELGDLLVSEGIEKEAYALAGAGAGALLGGSLGYLSGEGSLYNRRHNIALGVGLGGLGGLALGMHANKAQRAGGAHVRKMTDRTMSTVDDVERYSGRAADDLRREVSELRSRAGSMRSEDFHRELNEIEGRADAMIRNSLGEGALAGVLHGHTGGYRANMAGQGKLFVITGPDKSAILKVKRANLPEGTTLEQFMENMQRGGVDYLRSVGASPTKEALNRGTFTSRELSALNNTKAGIDEILSGGTWRI